MASTATALDRIASEERPRSEKAMIPDELAKAVYEAISGALA